VLGTRSYTSVAAILKNRRERASSGATELERASSGATELERASSGATELPLLIHENIRGPDYYH
jgi:hypothetical protein